MNLESPQQTGYVDRLEHGVHVDTATIRGQHGQTQALKPAGIPVVLVQKIGNFLGKVAKPWQGSKAHLSSAHKILPHQGPPANVAITSAPKLVRNFTPSLGPSPDVAVDSQAPANV